MTEPSDRAETDAPLALTPPPAPAATPRDWKARVTSAAAHLREQAGEAARFARAFALRHGVPLDGIEAALRAFAPRRQATDSERPAAAYDAHLRFGLVTCIVVVFGFGGWSAFASIRGAVVASGVISTEGQSRTIQHRDGGIVDAILVSDGDHVEAGDVLIRLDATSLRSELAIVENRLYEALARQARLEAERDDAPTMHRPALLDAMVASDRRWKEMLAGTNAADPKLVSALNNHAMADIRAESTPETGAEIADRVFSGQVRLFQARRDTLKAQVDRLQASIAQSQEQIKGIESQRESQERQRDLIQQELVGARALLKKGLIQLPRVLALERQEAELEGGIAGHNADVAAINQSISQLQLQILEAQRDMREKVLTELREAESNVQDLTEQRVAASDKLSRIDIRAPVSGTVNNLQVHTVGGVVKPADVLMSIVPDREALIVEARVEPQFVDQIRAGQAARIRLSAFDQRTTPELDGKLMTVSADRLTDTATNQPYYALKVSIAQAEIAKLDGKTLVPGMPAEVFLVTGDRTPLSYIMKPLTDQLARSMREQ